MIHLLNEEWGYRTRVTVSRKSGIERGGTKLSRSAGYGIFSNIFYAGYFRYDGQTYKAVVALASDALVSWEHREGEQANFTEDEFYETNEMLRSDPRGSYVISVRSGKWLASVTNPAAAIGEPIRNSGGSVEAFCRRTS